MRFRISRIETTLGIRIYKFLRIYTWYYYACIWRISDVTVKWNTYLLSSWVTICIRYQWQFGSSKYCRRSSCNNRRVFWLLYYKIQKLLCDMSFHDTSLFHICTLRYFWSDHYLATNYRDNLYNGVPDQWYTQRKYRSWFLKNGLRIQCWKSNVHSWMSMHFGSINIVKIKIHWWVT